MSPELTLYYQGFKNKEIAEKSGLTEFSVSTLLSAERKRLGLGVIKVRRGKNTAEFDGDKEIIMELKREGMPINKIAEKWGVGTRYAYDAIEKWDLLFMERVEIESFCQESSSMPDEFIITRGGESFKVVKL